MRLPTEGQIQCAIEGKIESLERETFCLKTHMGTQRTEGEALSATGMHDWMHETQKRSLTLIQGTGVHPGSS
jgi:hypothetical protein